MLGESFDGDVIAIDMNVLILGIGRKIINR